MEKMKEEMHLILFCMLTGILTSCQGLDLQQCVSNVIEVDETSSSNVVTCRGAGQNEDITWRFTASSGATGNIATCRPSGQCDTTNPLFSTTRSQSSTSSQLNFKMVIKTYRSQYGSLTLFCDTPSRDEVSCQLDVIHRAEVTSCSAQNKTAGKQWTVNGTCDVSKAYSERGRYSCSWTEHRAGSSIPIPASQTSLTKTAYTEGGTNYSSVTCSFNRPFPTVAGTYTYSVIISPGSVTPTVSGSNTIESPVSPSVTCSPSPYVPENQTVSCTCNTQSLGNPEGQLMWFRGNDLINTGNYGDTTLVMTPQPLTRSDHGNTVFRCDAGWSQSQVIRGEQYTASVGYIDSPTLTVSPVKVSENQAVNFTCRADDARPTPYVTLANRDNRTELTNQSPPLSHSVSRARCEDAGVYTCIASNGMGPDTMDDVTLRVKCTPRAVRGHSDDERPSVNFKGRLESLSFNMTAYPTPESFNFTFLGPNITTATTSPAGIALNASCQQKTGSLFLVTCTITVDNVTSTAAGLYKVTIINDQGHGDFIFEVKVNATEKIKTDPADEPNTQNIGAIVGGIVAAVFVAVVVAVVVVLFLRRRKDPERRKLDDGKELGSDKLTGETSALGVVGEFEEQDVVSKDVYAVVKKPKMSTAETSADQPETATYGVVNKNKPSSKPPTSGDSGANTCPPASKSKPKKEKGTKRKAVNKERTEHEYGNITLSMAPAGSSVVDTGKRAEKETKKSAGGAAVRQANQDGLLYTMVDFSGQRQQSTKPALPPDQQGVVYSDVLFNQSVIKQ